MMGDVTRRTVLHGMGLISASLSATPALARAINIPNDEGYAAVPGGKIYWRRFGAGKKTPLLTLHGGPGAAHNYLLTMRALADERPVIFYDQLGCGKADTPADENVYTIQRSVEELDSVRKALGLGRVILYGHSWGTLLAIEYLCQDRRAGVEKVILAAALSSAPQTIAGMQRRIDELPDGMGARIREIERAGKIGTPEYATLTQKFYDSFVLRTPPDAGCACVVRRPREIDRLPRFERSQRVHDRRKDQRLGSQQGSQGDHPADPHHDRGVR